jgi:hypothetical protein
MVENRGSVKNAAFEMGAAPITLINGDTLIDLLIQHENGVKKKTGDYYVRVSHFWEAWYPHSSSQRLPW